MSIYHTYSQSKNSIIMLVGFILLLFSMTGNSAPYVPPIGIPAPEFGINETVESVYGSGDYFTHYVDNTDVNNATDENNPHGSVDKPRMTIPLILAAGSVVEVHGGPYSVSKNEVNYQLNGMQEAPVFIRGISREGVRTQILGVSDNSGRTDFNLSGKYFIIENFEFFNRVNIRFDPSAQYGTLRNSEVHNPIEYDEEGRQIGAALNPTISATGNHTVIYNNEIHDNFGVVDKDVHGIQGSAGGDRVWVLNNKIYNNGGDGFQACHKCDRSPLGQPENIYIGGNDFNGDKENGVDLKYATDVIISQNTFSNYKNDASTGPACPIVVGSDGAPTRVWIIFNEIFDSKRSIRVEEVTNLWIVGNVIHNIETTAIALEKRGNLVRVTGNTVYKADLFIDQFWRHEFSVNVHNNIISNMAGTRYGNHMNFESSQVYPASNFQNNLFWQNGNDVLLTLNTNDPIAFSASADFDAYPFGNNNIIADPFFVDPENNDFALQLKSAARDVGLSSVVYQEFYDLYKIDIRQDKNSLARPQDEAWDIGAYEYSENLLPAPSALSATVISSSQIDLTWTDNSSDEDGFAIEYSTDDGNNFSELTRVAANVTTYRNSGLNADSTYHYRLFSYYDSGNSAYSGLANATTQNIIENSVPTDIQIDNGSSDSVAENTASGTVISTLTSTDTDMADSHNYSLVVGAGDEDNAKFTISESNLVLAFNPDYENPVDLGDTTGNNRYSIRIQTDDGNGGLFEKNFIITIIDLDEVAPVIALIGDNPQTIIPGTAYSELGSSASDNVDGDISATITIDTSAVDTTTVGSYSVTYNVSDVAGNAAIEVTRTVNVTAVDDVDNVSPVIILIGNNPQTITVGTAYVESGAIATDNVDGDISNQIMTDASAVDIANIGLYSVTYNVSDAAGNAAIEITRMVNVIASTANDPEDSDEGIGIGVFGPLLGLGLILLALRRRRQHNNPML